MNQSTHDPRVDAYIAKSADFAKPILTYLRALVHETSPLITETIKWGFPFFDYNGPVCQMASFKQHCAFGFWKQTLIDDPDNVLRIGDGSAGSFGPIKSIDDLPSKAILQQLILKAMDLNVGPTKVTVKKAPAPKTELVVPDYLIEFLSRNTFAIAAWEKFSTSHKREYAEWILDAKSDATRQKRMETALEWIIEGKSRNWKYQK